MDTNTQTEVFFMISSVGFVTLWILVVVFLIYLIRVMHSFNRIVDKIENDIEVISDATKEVLLDIKDNTIYRLLFGSKRKK